MTAAEFAALRVTVLETIAAGATEELDRERKDAATVFKAATSGLRASTGAIQVDIPLPDGQVIGHVSIKADKPGSETDGIGLHEWCAERNTEALEPCAAPGADTDQRLIDLLLVTHPDLLEYRLKPGALEDPRMLGLLQEKLPDLVSSRVRPGSLKAYEKEALKNTPKGWLFDAATGEGLHLVKETPAPPPSGAFMFIGAETPARRAAVMAALAAGDPVVRSIAFGAVGELGPSAAPDGGES
jgi:hypothetical protein